MSVECEKNNEQVGKWPLEIWQQDAQKLKPVLKNLINSCKRTIHLIVIRVPLCSISMCEIFAIAFKITSADMATDHCTMEL